MTTSVEARNPETKVSLRQRFTRAAQRLVDVLVCALAFLLAYLLRLDFAIPPPVVDQLQVQLPYVVLLQVVTLGLFGIQTFIWRYVGMAELKAFLKDQSEAKPDAGQFAAKYPSLDQVHAAQHCES